MNELFLKIINMSISASWLVPAVLLLRLVFKKAPKWVNVLLWGIVAVRLICPFTLESTVSMIPDPVGSGELVSGWMDDYIDDVDIHHSDSVYYDAAVGAGREPISDGEGGYYVVTKHDQLGEPATVENTVMPVLSAVWVAGMAALALYTEISYFRLRRKLNTAVRYKDNIYQSENVSAPFVLGIYKPKIYLPFKLEGRDLAHVVAHEQAHIDRKDHWWKPLGFLLLTVHWFNPLMWAAYILLCRDIELACDEKVIRKLGNDQRADYTQALVACSVNRRMIAACPLAFGEVGVKKRVRSVMNYKKPAFWVVILAVIACVGVAVCFLTDPKRDSYTLRIVVPAGSQEEFVYSDEEVSTVKNSIKIRSGDGLGDTEVLLSPVNETTETENAAAYLTRGMPVEFDAKKDTWFKIGVNVQNPTDEDMTVYVEVENVEVRISEESEPGSVTLETDILEIFQSGMPEDETVIVTDHVYADDGAYGLDGVVQYTDETGAPWKLGFVREGVVHPVSQEWDAQCVISGELTYLGNGIVQVYVEDTRNGAVYQCSVEYTYDPEESKPHFKATSNKIADRTLTQEEIDRVNDAFSPILFDEQGDPVGTNIWSCFFTSYYADVREMDFAAFLKYFPGDGSEVDEAEFAVLKEQKDFMFYGEVSSLADMPVPVNRYPAQRINQMLTEYAGITVDDLDTSGVDYLSEYDAYYNYTSDFGPGMFTCTRGEIDGDVVRLYEEMDYGTDLLILKRVETGYQILSHRQVNRD